MDIDSIYQNLFALLPFIASALETKGIVGIVSLWNPIPGIALLPFCLHTKWPDRVDAFPLSTTITLYPCSGADRRLLEEPLSSPEEVYNARTYARWYRYQLNLYHPDDFQPTDWEEGYRRHRNQVSARLLGSNSYLAVGIVSPTGSTSYTPRPVLGQLASRNVLRLALLIAGRGSLSDQAIATLAMSHLTIINLQQVRGQHLLDTIRHLLTYRMSQPTLLVTSSPSDLLALGMPEVEEQIALHSYGSQPALEQLHIVPVGKDRLQEEQKFRFAVTELRGHSSVLDTALDLLESIWWAVRQSLDVESASAVILPKLSRAEALITQLPVYAGLLNSAHALITSAINDKERTRERLESLLQTCEYLLNTATPLTKIGVIVRNELEVNAVQHAMSTRWNISHEELQELGIEVRSIWTSPEQYTHIVTSGYVGMRTLDIIFASRAQQATFLLDPLEAYVASFHVNKIQKLLDHTAKKTPLSILQTIATSLQTIKAQTPASTVHVDIPLFLRYNTVADPFLINEETVSDKASPSVDEQKRQFLVFTDGTSILCNTHHCFDLLDSSARSGFVSIKASELQPGDEIIVIERNEQGSFSHRLMKILDGDILKDQYDRRFAWLSIVSSIAHSQKRTIKSIHQGLLHRGISVDYATVRTWIRKPDELMHGLVPQKWAAFKALADELQIALPEEVLRSYHHAAKIWRVKHRQAGRTLARLMRHASLGKLDAATLDEVETQWGLKVRDLLRATRICMVDEVVIY